MGQAVLTQHRFQRVDLGRNIETYILQQRIVQFAISLIQRMQNSCNVTADVLCMLYVGFAQPLRGIQKFACGGQVIFPKAPNPRQLRGMVVRKS